jgi:two-component system nitrate/nitrite response regulator NarL
MQRTVLIVDDHAPFRRLARRVLESGGFSVVGEAADGASVLPAVAALRPEVVLLDVVLPDANGFEVADRVCAEPSPPRVILTSSRERVDFGNRLERPGAHLFLPKSELSSAALESLLAGP